MTVYLISVHFFHVDDSWPLHSGASSGDGSGSGEAQADTLWWGQRSQVALVNTVAFRGVWQKQFMFTNTQNLPFMLSDGSTIKVPMMHQAAEVRYGKILHDDALILPSQESTVLH